MAVVGDSGAIYALYDRGDSFHPHVARAVRELGETIIVPVLVLAEVDYLLRSRVGLPACLRLIDDTLAGAYNVAQLEARDVVRCRALMEQYDNIDLGLCDASVVATAERLGIRDVFTVDERDFRLMRTNDGGSFRLLPSDLGYK